jgi:hypothetical protein
MFLAQRRSFEILVHLLRLVYCSFGRRISSTFVNNMQVAKNLHATNERLGSVQKLVVLQLLSSLTEKQVVLLDYKPQGSHVMNKLFC